jgi:hypothetical protein
MLIGAASVTSAIAFAASGPVDWAAAAALSAGMLAGSTLGPRVTRRMPTTILRWLIALLGRTPPARGGAAHAAGGHRHPGRHCGRDPSRAGAVGRAGSLLRARPVPDPDRLSGGAGRGNPVGGLLLVAVPPGSAALVTAASLTRFGLGRSSSALTCSQGIDAPMPTLARCARALPQAHPPAGPAARPGRRARPT